MALFSYTALNPENKKLMGAIEADSEMQARENLNRLNFSIIELQLLKEPPKIIQGIKFNFEALDKNQKKIIGTIDAQNDLTAYIRLAEEYNLQITLLLKENASDEEKIKASEYLADLQKKYEEKLSKEKKKKAEMALQKKHGAYEKEKRELLAYIDKVIQIINIFLNEYGNDMKPEEREIIRSYINQLFRIKDSTNLAHIRTTCENMLRHIAEKEIFLKEAKKLKTETTVKLETKELLETLQKRGLKREIDLLTIVNFLRNVPVFSNLISYFQITDPEILELKRKIKEINHRIFELWKLYFHSKEKPYKREIKEIIHELRGQKKRLKWELSSLKFRKKQEKQAKKTHEQKHASLYTFISILLSFYLVFYFITFPLTSNELNFTSIPESFYFYKTTFVKSLLIFLFLFYIAMTLKRMFLFSGRFISFLLYPLCGITYLLFLFNFVL